MLKMVLVIVALWAVMTFCLSIVVRDVKDDVKSSGGLRCILGAVWEGKAPADCPK